MKLVDKYLIRGYSLEEALVKVQEIKEKRSTALKASWSDPVKRQSTLEKRKISLIPKLKGKKRTEEQKKKIKESVAKSIEQRKRDPKKWLEKYDKMKKTFENKSQEEKEKIKEKRVNSFKNWWKDESNVNIIIERNKKISKTSIGKKRTKQSREKQALTNTGRKQSEQTKLKRAETRKRKLENGESLGIRCKVFIVNGLFCQGTFERRYIEGLIKQGKGLPINGNYYSTPYGVYQADFEYEDRIIEVKSTFTYSIFNGETPNIDGHYNKRQREKIKWVGRNIKPVQLLVFDIKGELQKEEWFK